MNLVGHATAAAVATQDPDAWLGSVLPDLLPGPRLDRSRLPAAVSLGVDHHHRADAAFHADPRFTSAVATVRGRLAASAVARGPRRAAAHVGVELLIDDALLAGGAEAFDAVWARLAQPDDVVAAVVPPDGRAGWLAGLARLTSRLDPWADAGPAAAARRIELLLARRPRLALAPGDVEHVAGALAEVADAVAADASHLVADVAAAADPPPRRGHISGRGARPHL